MIYNLTKNAMEKYKKELLEYLEQVPIPDIYMGDPKEYYAEVDEIMEYIDAMEERIIDLIERIKFPEDYKDEV